MKYFALILLLISVSAMAQQDPNSKLEMGIGLNQITTSPTAITPTQLGMAADAKFQGKSFLLAGGIGNAGGASISVGWVNIEFNNGNSNGEKSRKVKLLVAYNPLLYSTSVIAKTTEAFLGAKLGIKLDRTRLRLSFSPVGSVVDHQNTSSSGPAIFYGGDLEQQIGDHLSIVALVKYANIGGEKINGNYTQQKAQISYSFKNNPVTILAYYENETLDYLMVDNTSRVPSSEKSFMSTVGVGVKINLNAMEK